MGIFGKGRFGRIDRRLRLLESFRAKAGHEMLEIRCVPAASVMNLTATGVLSYQAAAGDANDLDISVSGGNFVFLDSGTGVTIDASTVPGAVQIAPNKISVPVSTSIVSMLASLSDLGDRINLSSDIAGRAISVHGGAGDDLIDLDQSNSLTVAFGEAGNDSILAGQNGSFVLGGDGNDSLTGGAGRDSINGGLGNDAIQGGGENDLLGELPASPYAMPEVYGLLVYTGLADPLTYVNQLVSFDRDNPSYVKVVGDNGIDPNLYFGTGLDFDESGNLYMTTQTNTNFFFKVDKATGAATLIGGSGLVAGTKISDLSWDPVGNRMLGLVDSGPDAPGPLPQPRLVEIDLATGALNNLATLAIDDNKSVSLSVDAAGNYYVLGLYTNRWYRVDRNSYAVTPMATLPFDASDTQQGATVDWSHNDVLYYAAFEEIAGPIFRNGFYTVNKSTGGLSAIGAMGLNINGDGSTQYADVAIDPLSDQGYAEPGDDSISGGSGNDSVRSGEGNDFVDGGEGDDSLLGGSGNDSILGRAGNDTIHGEDGDDTAQGGEGDDSIYGGNGVDSLLGDAGNDRIDGEAGKDRIEGGAGGDLLCGDAGDDVIYGYSGNDTILGGEGNDSIDGGVDSDLIAGGQGDDSIYGNAGIDSILGGIGNDLVYGGDDPDLIFGEEGNDTILGGASDDLMYGGDDDDQIYGGTLATANTMHLPRNPTLASDGNDTILGGGGFDHVDGGNGDNLLDAGDDGIRETVLAGPGNDMMYSHKYSDRRKYDRAALDGGFNHDLCRGALVQPAIPAVPAQCEAFAAALIPIEYYSGRWLVHGNDLIEYPAVERVPGNRKGFTPPFRGAQPRVGVRPPVRIASQAGINSKGRSRNG